MCRNILSRTAAWPVWSGGSSGEQRSTRTGRRWTGSCALRADPTAAVASSVEDVTITLVPAIGRQELRRQLVADRGISRARAVLAERPNQRGETVQAGAIGGGHFHHA